MELVHRYFQHPGQSFFLFGPRGTGKSTWLKHHVKDAFFIDLLEPDTFRTYSARPERLKEIADGQEKGKVIVIDEVQKIPQLLDVVHQLLEMRKDLVFILTGSSARKIRRTGVNLLAGRAVIKEMHPFMASELGDSFSLDQAIVSGMLPLVMASPNPDDTLKAYASFYLKEEVQMEGLARNIGAFSRFMESISFSHGGILNLRKSAATVRSREKQLKVLSPSWKTCFLLFGYHLFRNGPKDISHHIRNFTILTPEYSDPCALPDRWTRRKRLTALPWRV